MIAKTLKVLLEATPMTPGKEMTTTVATMEMAVFIAGMEGMVMVMVMVRYIVATVMGMGVKGVKRRALERMGRRR